MKLFRFLPLPVLTAALLMGYNANAQQKKPKTWEEQKAARLGPLSEDAIQKIAEAAPSTGTSTPKKERKILVFWRCGGFVHTSINEGNEALRVMGEKTKAFSSDFSDDYAVFTKENLAQYDLLLFNNTTHLNFPEESMKEAIVDFVAQGKGIAGLHAASDNFTKWKFAGDMIGGQFNGHPWNAGGTWAFQLDDPDHPINKAFEKEGFWHQDEIYQYQPDTFVGAKKLRILVSLDMTKEENTKVMNEKANAKYGTNKRQVPVSWIREYEGGRVFYTNLGHRDETFWNTQVLQHMLDGIQYALGDLEADATPTGENPAKPVPAPQK